MLELGDLFICDRYAFRLERSGHDAWGQRRIEGRTFDIATMTLQRRAWVTGPDWATDRDLVTIGFRHAGVM